MVQGVTPAHKGLAPSKLIPYLRYGKDAHAGHTQDIKSMLKFVSNQSSCSLATPDCPADNQAR